MQTANQGDQSLSNALNSVLPHVEACGGKSLAGFQKLEETLQTLTLEDI